MSLSAVPNLPVTTPLDRPTAVVYCEANFGQIDGKTANGLVRHSETYEILAVIDSQQAGRDSGVVLDGEANAIPIRRDLDDILRRVEATPDVLIFGLAPTSGMLSTRERGVLLDAMSRGLGVVCGLHEFLAEDPEFVAASLEYDVPITDIRRPRAKKDLRTFSGRILEVTCPRIAVLGTDCAIGKRTTATALTRALNASGLHAVMIGTGQTGLMQGARYGVALDAVPAQFGAGEMEAAVVDAFDNEDPDVIVIEGQGALSHPAYSSSAFVLRGSRPDGVILQHAPARPHLSDFPMFEMPTPEREIDLIEAFADTRVIGLTINHENMTDAEVSAAITLYEASLSIPTTDALTRPSERLVEMVVQAFPRLARKLSVVGA
ncbi:MAG TPA: DUF1611 domain-containing protein [Egicoccus sp.]|nr:DUF1611 domain-containing protein [Egicoccus sp.]HSK21550.1 DUF1611 domain-containing protein [Egicoccus sp.]